MQVVNAIIFIGILVFLAHLFSAIFSRTRIPDALELITIGLLLGPVLGVVTPEAFGVVGPVFITITLVVILFESGVGLHPQSLRQALQGTLTLTTLTFLATMLLVGFVTWFLTDLDLLTSIMLGAIVGSVSPAVVVPLVRQLKMDSHSRTTLVLESALSDVISIVIALAILETLRVGQLRFGLMMGHLISAFLQAIIFGMVGAFVWSILLNKIRTLQNAIFTTPAFVFVIFGIVESLGYSGYIAALAFGFTIGNIELFKLPFLRRYIPHEPIALNETEKVFFAEVVFLLQTFFFVYIGLSIKLTDLSSVLFGFFLTLLIFAVRIPVVKYTAPKTTSRGDALYMSIMVPKGLAAAVLASVPLQEGIVGGELIQNTTYAVVFFSIIFTTCLIFLLEKTKLSQFYEKIFSDFSTSPQTEPEKIRTYE